MTRQDFIKTFKPSALELKAFDIGANTAPKKRNSLEYDLNSDKDHIKEAVAALEAASILKSSSNGCRIITDCGEHGEITDESDEIAINGKYLALFILKGLSLSINVIKHLDNVKFNETFNKVWIEYPNKDNK